MQNPEHVTSGDRSQEKFFRVVFSGIAPEGGIGRSLDRVFALRGNAVAPLVAPVARGSVPGVARPADFQIINMFFHNPKIFIQR